MLVTITMFTLLGRKPVASIKVKVSGCTLPGISERESETQRVLRIWRASKRQHRIKTTRETPAEINRRMRMKFLPKIEAMTPYETIDLDKFHIDFDKAKLKPKRRKSYEFKPLPSVAGETERKVNGRGIHKLNRIIQL